MAEEKNKKSELTDSVKREGYHGEIDGETFFFPKGGLIIENGMVKQVVEPFFEIKSDKAYYELANAGVIKVDGKDARYLAYFDKVHKQEKLYK